MRRKAKLDLDLQKIRAMISLFHKWQPKERLNNMTAKYAVKAMLIIAGRKQVKQSRESREK